MEEFLVECFRLCVHVMPGVVIHRHAAEEDRNNAAEAHALSEHPADEGKDQQQRLLGTEVIRRDAASQHTQTGQVCASQKQPKLHCRRWVAYLASAYLRSRALSIPITIPHTTEPKNMIAKVLNASAAASLRCHADHARKYTELVARPITQCARCGGGDVRCAWLATHASVERKRSIEP